MLLPLPRRSLLKSWQLKFEVIWFWLISPSGTMGRGQTLEGLGGKWEGVKSGFDTVCLLPTNLEVDEEEANRDLGQYVIFFCMLAECICMFNWKPLNPVLLLFMYSAHSAQFQINLFIFRFANFFTAITWHWQPCWIPRLQKDLKFIEFQLIDTQHFIQIIHRDIMVVGFIHILIVNYKTWPTHFALTNTSDLPNTMMVNWSFLFEAL